MMLFLLKSSLCLCVFYAFYTLFLRKETFFQRNRYYLLWSPMLALFIPWMNIGWFFAQPGIGALPLNLQNIEVTLQAVENKLQQNTQIVYSDIWVKVYGLGVLILVLLLFIRLGRLIFQIKNSQVKYCRGYKLICTEGKYPTFSFFGYLFWDNSLELDAEKSDKILMHELKHIWDGHSVDVFLMEVFKIIFWFNPVIYLFKRDLRLQHEYIADAYVLHESDLKAYTRLIVETCFQKLNLSLAHSFFKRSEVKQRIAAMQRLRTPVSHSLKILLLIPIIALLFFSFAQRDFSLWQETSPSLKGRNLEMNRFATAEGGLDKFYQDLSKHLVYPEEAIRGKIQGKVFIQFTVMQDGQVADLKVIKGFHPACDRAALEAFHKTSTRWLPAKVDGKPVKQQLYLPVTFSAGK